MDNEDILRCIFDHLFDFTTEEIRSAAGMCRRWRSLFFGCISVLSFTFDHARPEKMPLAWFRSCVSKSSRPLDISIFFIGAVPRPEITRGWDSEPVRPWNIKIDTVGKEVDRIRGVEYNILDILARHSDRIQRLSMGPGHRLPRIIALPKLRSLHHSFKHVVQSRDKITDLAFPLGSLEEWVTLSDFTSLETLSILSSDGWNRSFPNSVLAILPTVHTLHLAGDVRDLLHHIALPNLQTVRVYGPQALDGINPLTHCGKKAEYKRSGLLNAVTLELPTQPVATHRLVMILSIWPKLRVLKMAGKFEGRITKLLIDLNSRRDAIKLASPGISYKALEDLRFPASWATLYNDPVSDAYGWYDDIEDDVSLVEGRLVRYRSDWN